MKTYLAEYADDEIEVFNSENDKEAIDLALSLEIEHGILWNVREIDDNFNILSFIY